MKYQVGDKVVIRNDLVVEQKYGKEYFVSGMRDFLGKTVTISSIHSFYYNVEETNYCWSDEMIDYKIDKPLYSVGDRVLIREDCSTAYPYKDASFVDSMASYKGKIAIITKYIAASHLYKIDLDRGLWAWDEQMLTPVSTAEDCSKTCINDIKYKCSEEEYNVTDRVYSSEYPIPYEEAIGLNDTANFILHTHPVKAKLYFV